jgi:hypothetical protein
LFGDNDSNIHVSQLNTLHEDIRTCLGEAMLNYIVPILQPLKKVLLVLTKCFEQDVDSETTFFDANTSSGLPTDTKSIASEIIGFRGSFLGLFRLTDIVQLKLDSDMDHKIHMCAVLMSPDVAAFLIAMSSIRAHVDDSCPQEILETLVSHIFPALKVASTSLDELQSFCGKFINESYPVHKNTDNICRQAKKNLSTVEEATISKIHEYLTKVINETHAMLTDANTSGDFDFASDLTTNPVDPAKLYQRTQSVACRSLCRTWMSLRCYVGVARDLYSNFSQHVHSKIKLIADCIASKIPAIQTAYGCCMVVQATSGPLCNGESRAQLVQNMRAILRDENFPVLPNELALFMERIQKEAHAADIATTA